MNVQTVLMANCSQLKFSVDRKGEFAPVMSTEGYFSPGNQGHAVTQRLIPFAFLSADELQRLAGNAFWYM